MIKNFQNVTKDDTELKKLSESEPDESHLGTQESVENKQTTTTKHEEKNLRISQKGEKKFSSGKNK